MKLKTILMDENAVNRAITRLSHEILEKNGGADNIALIGIKTRGVPLANAISEKIKDLENTQVPVGELDITLYRDDLSELNETPLFNKSEINFNVKGKDVVLCDDVIFTGRTVRSAIDGIMKLGRPKTIQLVTLIDRGHRELPIRADFVGKNVPTSLGEVICVKFKQTDNEQSVGIYEKDN